MKRKLKRRRKANALKQSDDRKMVLEILSHELKKLVKDSKKKKSYTTTLKRFLSEAPAKFWRYVNP